MFYCSGWERIRDLRLRRMLKFMIARSQIAIEITAFNMVTFDMKLFVAVSMIHYHAIYFVYFCLLTIYCVYCLLTVQCVYQQPTFCLYLYKLSTHCLLCALSAYLLFQCVYQQSKLSIYKLSTHYQLCVLPVYLLFSVFVYLVYYLSTQTDTVGKVGMYVLFVLYLICLVNYRSLKRCMLMYNIFHFRFFRNPTRCLHCCGHKT